MAQVVGGRYHLVAHLGGGAVSDVSLAKTDGESEVAKLVVVKRLHLGADAEPELTAHFAEEARLAARLKHPNIAEVLETGEDDEGPFLVLEYLEGQTLARIRSRAQRRASGVPRAIALQIVMAVATGLSYAHAAEDDAKKPLKLVHGDVSPENIVVTYAGATKLIDFSVATAGASAKARAGAPKGNVAYMPPELASSAVKPDERADVFALGLVLWELLAGKRMWQGMSEAEVLARLADDKPLPTLRSVVADMPEELDAICTQALAKVRDDRFESAAEMREAIEKAAASAELKATTPEVAELVTSLFEDEREKMRATVDEALVSPAASDTALPRLRPAPPGSADEFADVDTNPNLWAAAAPRASAAPAAPARVVEVLRVEQAPSPDRRFAIVVGGVVLVAFAVVGAIAITKGDKKNDAPPVVSAARPTATVVPPVPSYKEPEEVTIDITARPPAARIFIDGVKGNNNPHRTRVVRGKYMHEVRAEAEGFETRTMKVAFDRNRAIDIELTPKPPVFVPQPRIAPPKPDAGAPARKPDAGAPPPAVDASAPR